MLKIKKISKSSLRINQLSRSILYKTDHAQKDLKFALALELAKLNVTYTRLGLMKFLKSYENVQN